MTTTDELDRLVDFDVPFRIMNGELRGVVPVTIYSPNVFFDPDRLGKPDDLYIESDDEWDAISGYSGQYGYHGASMHQSETLSGGLAKYVLENNGIYVLVVVYSFDDPSVPSENGYGAEPDSWAILKFKGEWNAL